MHEQPLWPGAAPGSEAWTHEELAISTIPDAPGAVRNVVVPTLASYPVEGSVADRPAVIIAPGGAFHLLSMENEGHDVARALAQRGVAAHVVKYRLVPTPAATDEFHRALAAAFMAGMDDAIASTLPLAIADIERAVAIVRAAGATHVTLLGFSAGARLVADVATGSPRDRRPDASGVIYTSPIPAAAVAPVDAEPLFLAAAADDPLVGISGELRLHELWRAAGRPVEMHLFERGGHGFGMNRQGLPSDHWLDMFTAWLSSQQT